MEDHKHRFSKEEEQLMLQIMIMVTKTKVPSDLIYLDEIPWKDITAEWPRDVPRNFLKSHWRRLKQRIMTEATNTTPRANAPSTAIAARKRSHPEADRIPVKTTRTDAPSAAVESKRSHLEANHVSVKKMRTCSFDDNSKAPTAVSKAPVIPSSPEPQRLGSYSLPSTNVSPVHLPIPSTHKQQRRRNFILSPIPEKYTPRERQLRVERYLEKRQRRLLKHSKPTADCSQLQSLADWLTRSNLSQYEQVLMEFGFDSMERLALVESEDLDVMKFKLGHKKDFLRQQRSLLEPSTASR